MNKTITIDGIEYDLIPKSGTIPASSSNIVTNPSDLLSDNWGNLSSVNSIPKGNSGLGHSVLGKDIQGDNSTFLGKPLYNVGTQPNNMFIGPEAGTVCNQPTYKAGDWVKCSGGTIRRMLSKDEFNISSELLSMKYGSWVYNNFYLIERLATQEEIRNHLNELAIKKGFVKGAKFKGIGYNSITEIFADSNQGIVGYDGTFFINGGVVFQNGVWAELVKEPKPEYKAGDWVNFLSCQAYITRRIVSDKEYKDTKPSKLKEIYGDWMTESAAVQFNSSIGKLLTTEEIIIHLSELAFKKGYKEGVKINSLIDINKVKSIDSTKSNKHEYQKNDDEFYMFGMCIYKMGVWAEIIKEPKLSFGGHECIFEVKVPGAYKDSNKEVHITCKGVTGTHFEVFNILHNIFKPESFGREKVKGYTLKAPSNTIPIFKATEADKYVDKVLIGCIETGTYAELQAIHNHCLNLLK